MKKYSLLGFMIACFVLACSNTNAPPVQNIETFSSQHSEKVEIIDKNTDQSLPDLTPQIKPEALAKLVLPAMLQGATTAYRVLPETTHNQALYLMRSGRYQAALYALELLPEQSKTLATRFLYAKAQILINEESANPIDIIPSQLLLQCKEQNNAPYLEESIEFWLIRAYILEHKIREAISALRTYQKKHNSSQRFQKLVLKLAPHTLQMSDQHKEVLSWLDNLIKTGNTFVAANALHLKAQHLQTNQPAKARELIKKLILHYPSTQMILWPELAQQLHEFTHKQRFERAQRLIKHFDYDNARIELRELSKNPDFHDQAQWLIAKISMSQNRDNPRESELIYRKVAAKNSPQREEATFAIVRALSRQLNYAQAIEAITEYEKRYPNGKYRMRCLYLKGWYHFELRNNLEARPYLLEYAQKTGDTAVWGFYAWTFIREKRWQEAIEAFEHLLNNSNPIVRGKALYWQAYAAYQLNNVTLTRQKFNSLHDQFPLTYYDILALQREEDWFNLSYHETLSKLLRNNTDPCQDHDFTMTPFGRAKDLSSLSKHNAWNKVLSLIKFDEIDAARAIYQKNEKTILASIPSPKREAFKAYATFLTENYNAAWKEASGSVKAMSDKYPERNNPKHHMAYPRAFQPLLHQLEIKFGVPAIFMYAIMLQESRFRPWQVSSADAIGALQMIPKTARALAGELHTTYHPETFFDPKIGFPYSALYMQKHMHKWHGNLTMTAGSYNGGPHRIGPWMLREKGATMDFLVEEFSFDESRHYCRKVAEHALRYIYLYVPKKKQQIKYIEMFFPKVVNYDLPYDDWGI